MTEENENLKLTAYLPSMREQEKIDFVLDFVKQVEDTTRNMREILVRCRKNYMGKFDSETTTYTKRPKVFYPLTWEKIDGMAPKLSVNPTALTLMPQEEGDVMRSKVFEELLRFQARKIHLFENFNNEQVKSLMMDGTLVAKAYWDYEAKKDDVKRDEVRVDFIDLLDFYIDPLADNIQASGKVAHKKVRLLKDIQACKQYKNRQYLDGYFEVKQKQSDSSATMDHDLDTSMVDSDLKKVTIIECWTEGRVVTIATDDDYSTGVLLRDEENPFEHGMIPFAECWYDKKPGRWYGIGMAERMLSLQNWANSVVNLRIDNQMMTLNKMFLKRRSANIDSRQLVSRPAGFIEVDDVNADIKPLEFTDTTRGALEELSQINSLADRALSSFELVRGGGNPKTASEAIIQNESSKGFYEGKLAQIRYFFIKIFEQIYQLDLQYMEEDMVVRITGNKEDFEVFDKLLGNTPEMSQTLPNYRFVQVKDMGILDGLYDLEIDFDAQGASRALLLRQIQDSLALSAQDPTAPIDRERLYRQQFRLMFGDKGDLFVKPLNSQEMQMQMANMLGGAAPGAQGMQGRQANALAMNKQTEVGAQETALGGVQNQLENQLGQPVL